MKKIFDVDNRFFKTLGKITDMIILSVLWSFCCIPIITVGASTTALYYAYHKANRQDRGYAWKEFLHAFKTNFKQSTIIWLMFLAATLVVGFETYLVWSWIDVLPFARGLLAISIAILILLAMWAAFLFPYVARIENDTKDVLINSFKILLLNFPWAVLLLLLLLISATVYIYLHPMKVLMPAIYIWLANRIMERIFRKYMTEEDLEEEKERDMYGKL